MPNIFVCPFRFLSVRGGWPSRPHGWIPVRGFRLPERYLRCAGGATHDSRINSSISFLRQRQYVPRPLHFESANPPLNRVVNFGNGDCSFNSANVYCRPRVMRRDRTRLLPIINIQYSLYRSGRASLCVRCALLNPRSIIECRSHFKNESPRRTCGVESNPCIESFVFYTFYMANINLAWDS